MTCVYSLDIPFDIPSDIQLSTQKRTTATTKTVIDHIVTNRPEAVSKSGVLSYGISALNVVS